jgi:hypothetical protein
MTYHNMQVKINELSAFINDLIMIKLRVIVRK